MRLDDARRALIDVLGGAGYSGRWRVIDAATGDQVFAPCIYLQLPVAVRDGALGERVARFTMRFYIDHAAEVAQYAELLNVLDEGGDLDVITDALESATPGWSTVMVNPDGAALTIQEELLGQIVAPYLDVPVDVWL